MTKTLGGGGRFEREGAETGDWSRALIGRLHLRTGETRFCSAAPHLDGLNPQGKGC